MRHGDRISVVTVVLAALVAATAAFFFLSEQPTVYEARARLLVGEMTNDFDRIRAAEALTTTYVELATSDVILSDAAQRLENDDVDAQTLREAVTAVAVGSSRILLLTVRADDRDLVTEGANAVAESLTTYGSGPGRNLTLLDPANRAAPVPDRTLILVVLSGLAGAATALGLLTLSDAFGQPRTA